MIICKQGFKKAISIFLLAIFMISNIQIKVNAYSSYQSDLMDISRNTHAKNINKGDTFDVTYKITPKPILAQSQNNDKKKDIVLLIDTSGSMNYLVDEDREANKGKKSRLDIMKKVAQSFVDKFNSTDNVNISLVEYSTYAAKVKDLTSINSDDNKKDIDDKIKALDAGGSTNIGDGLRVAYYLLNDKNQDDKYIILMTDGEAQACSIANEDYYMGSQIESHLDTNKMAKYRDTVYDELGDYNCYQTKYPKESLEYAKKVASEKIAALGIKTFVIGFGSGASYDKNKQIADSAKGTYFQAQSEDTINEMYNEMQKIITANVNGTAEFEETISPNLEVKDKPAGVIVENNKIRWSFNNIYYTLSDDEKCYIAQPIEFTIKYIAKGDGPYILGDNKTSYVKLNVLNNSDMKYFDKLEFNNTLPSNIMDVNRSEDIKSVIAGDTFDITYSIIPREIAAQQDDREKDIVLVIDTSLSMEWIPSQNRKPKNGNNERSRLDIMKDVTKKFIKKFKDNSKIRISLIEYNKAAYTVFGFNKITTSNIQSINNYVDSLGIDSNTNIGDGLRKAYYSFNDEKKDKYIILMTDGQANTWWHKYNKDYYIESGEPSEYADLYQSENGQYGLEYAKKVASELIGKSSVKSFVIGFGSEAGSNNNQIAVAAKGTYYKADDEKGINNIYDGIQKIVEANVSASAHFEENISDNLEYVSCSDLSCEFKPDKHTVEADINNKLYALSSDKQHYVAQPILFKIKYRVKDSNKNTCILGPNETSFVEFRVNNEEHDHQKKNFKQFSIGVNSGSIIIKHGIFIKKDKTGDIKEPNKQVEGTNEGLFNVTKGVPIDMGMLIDVKYDNFKIDLNITGDYYGKNIKFQIYSYDNGNIQLIKSFQSQLSNDTKSIIIDKAFGDFETNRKYIIVYTIKSKNKQQGIINTVPIINNTHVKPIELDFNIDLPILQ